MLISTSDLWFPFSSVAPLPQVYHLLLHSISNKEHPVILGESWEGFEPKLISKTPVHVILFLQHVQLRSFGIHTAYLMQWIKI